MQTRVGVWIDHREAVIVVVTDTGEDIRLIKGPYEPQATPAEDIHDRAFMGHLNIYYDEVITCIRDAEAIVILGPGEAKGELTKRLERDNRSGQIIGIETADKMTHRQIAAKVHRYFQDHSGRQ
jgi:stalled ribosome rescue protein Dom34